MSHDVATAFCTHGSNCVCFEPMPRTDGLPGLSLDQFHNCTPMELASTMWLEIEATIKERDAALADLEAMKKRLDRSVDFNLKLQAELDEIGGRSNFNKISAERDGFRANFLAEQHATTVDLAYREEKLAAAQAEIVALRQIAGSNPGIRPQAIGPYGTTYAGSLGPTVAQPLLDALAEAHRAWSFFFGFLDREAILQDWPNCLADIIEARQAITALAPWVVK